jgi:hypothetical protein
MFAVHVVFGHGILKSAENSLVQAGTVGDESGYGFAAVNL